MSKKKSMKYQVQGELSDKLCIGQSRHKAKNESENRKPQGIYSWSTYENYVTACTAFGKWVKEEFKVSSIKQAKQKSRDQWIISEDECIRIISDELFEAVSQKTTARKKGGANKAIEKYLLSGKVFCGKCGCSMSGNRRRGGGKKYYTSYSCTSRNSEKGACKNKEIKRDVIETAVMDYLTDYIFNEHTIDMVISKYENYISEKYSFTLSKSKGLENKISELEKKIKRVVEILVSSDSDALLGKLNELEKEKRRAPAKA